MHVLLRWAESLKLTVGDPISSYRLSTNLFEPKLYPHLQRYLWPWWVQTCNSVLHLAFPSAILSFCFLHFAKFLSIHSSYFQLSKFHLYYDFFWKPINPIPVAFSESVSQSIKWKQSCFLSSTRMWIPPDPWLTHILSPPLAVRISEGLWPELRMCWGCSCFTWAASQGGNAYVYSPWHYHRECHKNISFIAAPISESLETNPVTHRGDEEGEEKREKDKWPVVLLCPDSPLGHPFLKWVDPTSRWTPWVATAEAQTRLLQHRG